MNEAEIVVSGLLGCSRPQLYARAGQRLEKAIASRLGEILRRRAGGEPLAYITGTEDFYGLSFAVTPDVLVPRQDTEVLVEAVLQLCRGIPAVRILEIGTGSGAIAVTLAVNCPQAEVVATDISPAALAVARQNIVSHSVEERITLVEADLFPVLPQEAPRYDLIVSNPPYIPSSDIDGLEREVRCEPRLALDGGAGGLDYFHRIVSRAAAFLNPRGRLVFEVGFGQRQAVEQIIAGSKNFFLERVIKDYNGIDRVIIAQLRG